MMDTLKFYFKLSDIPEKGMHEVKFLYPGNFDHKLYGKFNTTIEKFKNAVQNFKTGIGTVKDEEGKDFLYTNYNHPNLKFNTDEEKAKASGRIYDLFLKGEELFAKILWTDKAKDLIRKKEMNHISPEFAENFIDENGKDHGFTARGLALTPVPFLKYNQLAISLNESNGDKIIFTLSEESTMEKKLREILGLNEDADAAAIEKAVTELKEKAEASEGSKKEIEKKLSEAETKLQSVEKKLSESGNGNKEIAELKETIKTLTETAQQGVEAKKELAKRDAVDKVEKFLNEGKIVPAQKESMIKLAINASDQFDEIMKDAKPVIDFKESGDDGDGIGNDVENVKLNERANQIVKDEKIPFDQALIKASKEMEA